MRDLVTKSKQPICQKLIKHQDKTLKLINFHLLNVPAQPLYQEMKILKINDFINYRNILLVKNSLRKDNLPIFNEMFTMLSQNHTCETRAATYNLLDIPEVRTAHFGESSIKFKASQTGNDLQINFNSDILIYSYSELKKAVFQTYLENYINST